MNMRKRGWFILWIAMQGLLILNSGCRRSIKNDPLNMAETRRSAVEIDPHYMACHEFSGSTKSVERAMTEKIVILYSSGGAGHKSAADAVERALHAVEEQMLGKGRKYVIAQVDVLYGLLPKQDLFDEYLKAEEWGKLKNLSAMQGIAEKLINARQVFWDNKVLNRIMRACDERPPSMLISVFPVANYVYADIAKKNNIPMVIVPTDYEISHFLNKIDESNKQSANVFLSLPLKEPEVLAPLHRKGSSKPSIPYCITGYPLRHEFIALRTKIDAATKNGPLVEASEIVKYRQSVLKVPRGAKSLMITLGGKGGALELILQYLQKLHFMQERTPLGKPLHVIIASGGDQAILDGLKAKSPTFANNALFKTQILGRLDARNMALTIASVDAVLLKPGGSTVAEAIMLGTPMIIKSDSAAALHWERTNMNLVKRLGWGVDLVPAPQLRVNSNDLVAKVKQVLNSPTRRNKTPFINFHTQFSRLVEAVQHRNERELDKSICVQ